MDTQAPRTWQKLAGKTRTVFATQAKEDVWKDLWILLTSRCGGPVRSTEAAAALGIEPRALVAWARIRSDLFATEYRAAEDGRKAQATYLRINPAALSAPVPIPEEHAVVVKRNTAGTASVPAIGCA